MPQMPLSFRNRPVRTFAAAVLAVASIALSACASGHAGMNMDGSMPVADDFDRVRTGTTRTYYIQAEPIRWNYVPDGMNDITGKPFTDAEKIYTDFAYNQGGSIYEKCVYRQYTDKTFSTQVKQEAYMGILGPTIYAEVGDRVDVLFSNKCPFDATIHVHGFQYAKDSEGAPYNDGDGFHDDDDVKPNTTYQYHYTVPQSAGPGPGEGSTALWMYHSHNDEVEDVYAGLTGFIVVTAHGQATSEGKPNDVDQMVFSLFEIDDENESRLSEYNFERYSVEDMATDTFHESNLKHVINGFLYGNGPNAELTAGSRVRWFLMDMGTEADVHTPHWHGNTAVVNGMRMDVVSLLPAGMATADMTPTNKGTWLFHCHVADHLSAGMVGMYTVK